MGGGGLLLSISLILFTIVWFPPQPYTRNSVLRQAIQLGIPLVPSIMDTSDSDSCPAWCDPDQPAIKLTFNDCRCSAKHEKPRGFRSYAQDLEEACKVKGVSECPSSLGIGDVRVSGSGQFCWKRCGKWLVNHLKTQSQHPILIDLRMEAHGFLDDRPVSWFCPTNWERLGWEASGLEPDEVERLDALGSKVEVYTRLDGTESTHKQATTISVQRAMTERQLVESTGIRYHRLHVPDHCHPLDAEVDELVSLWDSLPPDYWIHFHCKAGKGRTSTLMLLIDMLHNAHQVTLRDLIYRQYVVGLVDLASLDGKRDSYKYEPAVERLAFLQRFYEFARWRKVKFKRIGWMEWQRMQSQEPESWFQLLRRYLATQWFRLANARVMESFE